MFGRKRASTAGDDAPADRPGADDELGADEGRGADEQPRTGPFDATEVPDDDVPRVDLGGLLVPPREGVELRLQADQATGAVSSVLLAISGAALELRAFAAPKSGGLWDEVRREIAAEATRQGGTASESVGTYGPELRLQVPVRTQDGRNALQISRIVGVEGPRWFLRGTFLGNAATQADPEGPLEQAFTQVVVVRGQLAMPPRDALPLRLPPDVRAPAAAADPESPAEAGGMQARNAGTGTDGGADGTDTQRRGLFGRMLGGWSDSTGSMEAAELKRDSAKAGCRPIASHGDRDLVTLHGSLANVTLRPRGGVLALEAELYDGSGTVTLVWLGRRQISGIGPGRQLTVHGRLGCSDGRKVLFNPRYELAA